MDGSASPSDMSSSSSSSSSTSWEVFSPELSPSGTGSSRVEGQDHERRDMGLTTARDPSPGTASWIAFGSSPSKYHWKSSLL
eukprot:CAMPEP_0170649392 /NCGR_PEP_ID=MMETSP0224-20130122/45266_1 /TAXON_ID=285029 /ORGANISM="Togula jolla, Strain CCCM 725" /LENGTH=81 /DNA_ID=CAMNT_0010981027 /DNA_START=42 /DNA_END=287 /DNA_ORIENTATION=+